MQLTKFQKLQTISTTAKNLSVGDMLSHSFSQEELQNCQLKHKRLPTEIQFATLNQNN